MSSQNTLRDRSAAYSQQVAIRNSNRRKQPNIFVDESQSSHRMNNDVSEQTSSLREQVKQISHDTEQDVIDKDDFTQANNTGKSVPAIRTTAQLRPTNELKSAFSKAWTTVSNIHLLPFQTDERSYFTPSSIAIFEVLHSMDETLSNNEELRWISPSYFTLPVRIFYSVMFYVQILRAKGAANASTRLERGWLKSFFEKFGDTELPIAGPLVPIFSNIVSVLPSDSQFDYVHPDIPDNSFYSSTGSIPPVAVLHDSYHLIPNVVALCQMLHTFCNSSKVFSKTDSKSDYFNDLDEYLPINRNDPAAHLGGIPFGEKATPVSTRALANPALMYSLTESTARLREINSFWKRSRARKVSLPALGVPFHGNSIDENLRLVNNFDWFRPCIDMAVTQARFFSDSTNLSAIPTIGPESALITAHLLPEDQMTMPFTDSGPHKFYPMCFESTKATFVSTSSELEQEMHYAAAYALTNTTINWKGSNGYVGGKDGNARDGPYWNNSKVNFHIESPVYVLNGLSTMVQTLFYDAKGKTS